MRGTVPDGVQPRLPAAVKDDDGAEKTGAVRWSTEGGQGEEEHPLEPNAPACGEAAPLRAGAEKKTESVAAIFLHSDGSATGIRAGIPSIFRTLGFGDAVGEGESASMAGVEVLEVFSLRDASSWK